MPADLAPPIHRFRAKLSFAPEPGAERSVDEPIGRRQSASAPAVHNYVEEVLEVETGLRSWGWPIGRRCSRLLSVHHFKAERELPLLLPGLSLPSEDGCRSMGRREASHQPHTCPIAPRAHIKVIPATHDTSRPM